MNFWRIGDAEGGQGGRWMASAALDEGKRRRIPVSKTEVTLPVHGL